MSTMLLESNDQPQRPRDPDFIHAEAALHRAAQLARRRARQAGIGVIVMKDGKIVEEMQDCEPGVDEGRELPGPQW